MSVLKADTRCVPFVFRFIYFCSGGWVGGWVCGWVGGGEARRGCGWEGVWVAGGGAGGWYGRGWCYFRPHLQEHPEEERLKKENQEKKEKQRKTSPGDPGFPGVDPESPVSLGSQNPKISLFTIISHIDTHTHIHIWTHTSVQKSTWMHVHIFTGNDM